MPARGSKHFKINKHGRLQRKKLVFSSRRANSNLVRQPELVTTQNEKLSWPKLIMGSVIGLILVVVVWIGIGSLITFSKVSDKNSTKRAPLFNWLGEVQPNQLAGEGDGRVNVLLIGVGGPKHPGGTLADTIIVASFDPKNKGVALLSIPRDLYVPIEGNGWGKINSAHSYGEQNKNSGGGPAILKKTVSKILDLPIHYYVRGDFTALEKIVDTLGGVTVDVEKPIVDLSYPADNMIDYAPFRLSAGVQTLDGKTALKYARSRHSAGGEGSDFARARRQQKVIEAIKDKALSIGIVGNPKKIADIIGIIGDHLKTDLSLLDIERFFQLWKDVDKSKITNRVLDNGPDGPLVAHDGDARGYILLPRTGDYREVQQIAHEIFTDPYLREEAASIALVNATGNPYTGNQVINLLRSYGYSVTDTTSVNQTKAKTELLDHTKSKPYTKRFLEARFKLKAKIDNSQKNQYDLTLIIGADYKDEKIKSINIPAQPSQIASPAIRPTSPTPSFLRQ